MESVQTTEVRESTVDAYRSARVDHYLREAEGCYQMSRFGAAGAILEQLYQVDPSNALATALQQKIDAQIRLLTDRGGKVANPAGKGRGEVVLIVDQDETILARLSERLRRYGFNPVSAIDCDEALATAESISPNLVISEVNFANGPAGVEFFRWLRSRDKTRHTPFLFHATRIDRELLIAGKRLGVDDFLFKPADDEVVAASVSNCLSRSRSR